MSFKFEMLKEQSSIIKVIGVGGGGGNAVNHMYKQGISGVDFIICNTDAQALELSPIPNKVQLGASLTEGMGAGADPSVGENSAVESIEDIKRMLGTNTKMLFITAGMGGGTGTGASPVLAKAAKELGILTVAIVTTPFTFEGKRRRMQADEGLSELKKYVDSYLVISNDRLREIFGNLTMTAAFAKADDILTTAAKGIAEIITIPGYVNVDFKDVKTVMNDSGVAIMGNYKASGENRALIAVEGALASPLLKDNEIEGARYILLNITSGTSEVTMDEVAIVTDYIQEKAGLSADLIWGNCIDESLGDELSVTIIATGFQTAEDRVREREREKIEIPLIEEKPQAPLIRPSNQFIPAEEPKAPVYPQQGAGVDRAANPFVNPLFASPSSSGSAVAGGSGVQGGNPAQAAQAAQASQAAPVNPTRPVQAPASSTGSRPAAPSEHLTHRGVGEFGFENDRTGQGESTPKQVDLFSGPETGSTSDHYTEPVYRQEQPVRNPEIKPTPSAYPLQNQTPTHDSIIRTPLEPLRSTDQQDFDVTNAVQDGYELKTSPSPFVFEIPKTFDSVSSAVQTTTSTPAPEELSQRFESDFGSSFDLYGDHQASAPAPVGSSSLDQNAPAQIPFEDQLSRTKDRIMRLKELSMKLKSTNGLQELETEPAYKRKQFAIDNTPHSSDSQVSKFTLSIEDGVTQIKPNNSFLHDNVD